MTPADVRPLLAPYVGRPLEDAQLELVCRYVSLLLHWNRRVNLTAIREPEQIVTRHFGESLFTASVLYPAMLASASRLVDVGSGAGFPGMAMRIVVPLQLTLIEAREKKAVFLREVARALGFRDVEVFSDRAERYFPPANSNDLTVTMRAVERFDEALPIAAGILTRWRRELALHAHADPAPRRGRLALLIGAEQVPRAHNLTKDISWGEPLPIPRSTHRILLVGEAQPDSQ